MERKDTSASWRWTVQRRCLTFDSVLFRDGDQFCHMGWKQLPHEGDRLESDASETKVLCSIAGCSAVFSSLKKYEAHYNINHQHVCSICHKIMPSAHLLEIHILETHDNMFGLLAASKNMYQCLLESCTEKFPTACSRHEHMKKVHKYPANFRFDRKKQDRNKPQSTSKSSFQTSQKVKTESYPVEVSSLMDVCTVMDTSGKIEMASNVDLNVPQASTCPSTENDLDVGAKGEGNYIPNSKFNTDTFKKQRKESSMQFPADELSTDLKQCRTEQETFICTNTGNGFQKSIGSLNSNGTSMEDCNTDKVSHKAPARKFTYKVPNNVCFGHGSAKSFQRSKKGFSKKTKEKHWHSTAGDDSITKVNIENVDMSDLSSALMDQ
ncbi:hypothetical protein CHS0354_033450 [Potamilus streckersoni]|uniref:C2H2-type domain-containing protein n=1 Tax=Potamilus streckersoni TaxID=2493646 RepID=A0AAE0VWB6_9BIVA|nr:hypothetical protein CHS0354_033450 [Potamilus streckersoni]